MVAGYEQRMQMATAFNHLIKHDLDRIMIVDPGTADGGAMEWIEFLGL